MGHAIWSLMSTKATSPLHHEQAGEGRPRGNVRDRIFRMGVRGAVCVALALAAALYGQAPNDNFQESTLNTCLWEFPQFVTGSYQMQNGLVLTSNGTQTDSIAVVYSQYYAPGDFDVQVDYQLDPSWNQPIVPAGSNPSMFGGEFTAYFDSQNSVTISRFRVPGLDQLFVSGVAEGQTMATGIPASGLSGTLRMVRSGMTIAFMGLINGSWTQIGSWTGSIRPTVFGLSTLNVNANNSVITTFTNFQINSGATSYQAYELPGNPTPHPGFLPGWVSDAHLSWTVWGSAPGYDPQSILAANGVGVLREMITDVSDTALADTPFSQWGTLPWNNDYWSSLQMGEQEMRQAKSLGMQTFLTLFLSDTAANAGVQDAPAAWQGLSLEDTETALQQYTNQTAAYFISRGIKIDYYAIGNEIGTGILNFVPGQRLPAPQSGSPYDAIEFMENNVWPTEAQLLSAAVAGIRQADPNAKIVLHTAGMTLSPADLWTKAFFTTMVNLGVPFDVAGVSLPYINAGWTLPDYTPQCWCQKLAADFREFAALGKQGFIAEGAYPNTTVNISANAPMPAYPITPQGQASWIADMLRYASNDPNVIGFNYTFPDALPGVFGSNPPVDIESLSLFASATSVDPGMLEFNPFIGSANCTAQCPALSLNHQSDSATSPDGASIGYTLTVSNQGAGPASSVDLNDPLPVGGGLNWSITPGYSGPGTCTVSGVTGNQVLGCSFGNLAVGAAATVHVSSPTTSASCQTYGNTALLTADNNPPIQSGANTTVLCGLASNPPALSIAKSHTGNFTQGQNNATYTVTVSNQPGASATSGTVTVTEAAPTGLTLVSMSGKNWACTGSACMRSDALSGGASYDPITVKVNVASNAPSEVINQVSVSGGGSAMANAIDPAITVAVSSPPALSIAKSHSGTFTQGQSNATYAVTVSNQTGAGATIGTVTVTETVPTGLTLVLMSGTNWTCTGSTCSRSDALAGGSTYDAITVTVNVAPGAPSQVTNQVSVDGGGSATANASNPTTVTPAASGHPAFFSGEVSLSSGVYYLQFPDNNLFGYYNYVSSSIFYHYDMGYEAFISGSASDVYLYDFTSGHWWYTSSSLFPYLYDFTLNNWLYYFPATNNPGHYTTSPRSFSDLTTDKIITM
jgi:uncharacterized repeat protein (TIGR01451 family)